MRHFTNLSRLNFSVDTNFYPLGSCTMKYNPKFTETLAALEGFTAVHPLLPQLAGGGVLTQGSLEVLYNTKKLLSEITGMADFTTQPLAGAHGVPVVFASGDDKLAAEAQAFLPGIETAVTKEGISRTAARLPRLVERLDRGLLNREMLLMHLVLA